MSSRAWPIHCELITDCNSLFENVRSLTPHVSEKGLLRELAAFREAVDQRVVNTIRWTPSAKMLADSLTKRMDTAILRRALSSGSFIIRPTPSELTSKKGNKRCEYRYSGRSVIQ